MRFAQSITEEPMIDVGILSGQEIRFSLHGNFRLRSHPEASEILCSGRYFISLQEKKLFFQGKNYTGFCLEPINEDSFFSIEDVCIGIHFHWQQRQEQSFEGSLKFITESCAGQHRPKEVGHKGFFHTQIRAINRIRLERYLYSVIASEMSAKASLALLKAHAVISRSWLMAQLAEDRPWANPEASSIPQENNLVASASGPVFFRNNRQERICWYERDAHKHFDVCADDHCQRYQGIRHSGTPQVKQAIEETRGQILVCDGIICDTRFSKCCGGVTERFENCWADTPKKYLVHKADTPASVAKKDNGTPDLPDLSKEEEARRFILGQTDSFCHTMDKNILRQVLNDYDQATVDFYRWSVRYTANELAGIIKERSGIDFGQILNLQVIERSASGRIVRLRIVGSRQSLIVGKELEIRRILSRTHLYSSAFVVDMERDNHNEPTAFRLHGAGWGHGVGLCQIGAAVMGSQGYSYQEILSHYYPNTVLYKLFV